jgi:hypothetical protein
LRVKIQKIEVIISDVGKGCCSKKLQKSKMKKAKVEFIADKFKVVKTKYQDVSQKEATKDKTYVAQPFLRQG